MKILLTGVAGQLGQELLPRLTPLGEVLALDRNPGEGQAKHMAFDLSDEGRLETLLNRFEPELIVNAAAYTAVDQAEREREQAFAINASVPGRMARWAERQGGALLHYSTDYVFDGALDRPYVETDEPSPLNVYGESKLAGELAIRASGCRHLILRSSWIYSGHGNNFVLKMLDLARTRPRLRVVDDQIGCPTWARNLAEHSVLAIRKGLLGRRAPRTDLYHCADRDSASWFDFAALVFDTAADIGILEHKPLMERVKSEGFPQVARRPRFSVLDSRAIHRDLGVRSAPLEASLAACLRELVPA